MRARLSGMAFVLFVVLTFEIIAYGTLRLGLGLYVGLVVAASAVAAIVMAGQIKACVARAISGAMYIVGGRWPVSFFSFGVVVALIQLVVVALLRFGIQIGVAVQLVVGIMVTYFVWPHACTFLVGLGRRCVDKIKRDGGYRFSIRGLLLAMAIVAIMLTWFGGEYRRISQELAVVARLKSLGAEVVYDVKRDGSFITRDEDAASPSMMKRVRGAEGSNVNYVILNLAFTQAGMRNDKITDTCIAEISTLTQLRVLDLRGTAISDAGLVGLGALPELEQILVTGTKITAAGIQDFKRVNPKCDVYR